jgi:hypothetical protein
LVTYPDPYRIIKLTDSKTLTISSHRIESINYNTNGKTFQEYSKNFIQNGIKNIVVTYLTNVYGMDQITANLLAPYGADVFITHTQGDESLSNETKLMITALSLSTDSNIRYIASAMNSMCTDLPPKDNNLVINLSTGAATNPSTSQMKFITGF